MEICKETKSGINKKGGYYITIELNKEALIRMPLSHIRAAMETEWKSVKQYALKKINQEIKGHV